MESFGALVRRIRIAKGLLLREVAANLQIDPSFLSRIESDTKRATREHVIQLATFLKADENELLIAYLSDKIMYELHGEKLAIKAMSVAEKKILYLTRHSSAPTDTPKKNEAQ
jgi:transcriptional regulator with XRE-family HTH domain